MNVKPEASEQPPQGLSVREEAEWWDAHPGYWDSLDTPIEFVPAPASGVVRSQSVNLRLPIDLVTELKREARRQSTPFHALIQDWLRSRLAAGTERGRIPEIEPKTLTDVGTEAHSLYPTYREALLGHLFAGEMMRVLWTKGITQLEVLKPELDASGYDLVLEADSVIRYVQLKSSNSAQPIAVNSLLAAKPNGCVVLMRFDPATLRMGPFFFFGGAPGEPLPSLEGMRPAHAPRRNAQRQLPVRRNTVNVPRSRFRPVGSIEELATKLFGI